MNILPLRSDLERYLDRHQLRRKWNKQKRLFEQNWRHPSLNTELLEPKDLQIYSFRIDRQYRAIFVFVNTDTVEVIDINNHYH
jgi:plasmid maintenance system killer protein